MMKWHGDTTGFRFVKSTFSGAHNNCVEVATLSAGRAVRDSKRPDQGVQLYAECEWKAFLAGVRAGDFD
jgi:hypothetical protein